MRFLLWIVLALCLLVPVAAQEEGHIKILAITTGEGVSGSVADLSLEILPGKGRVFLETFPLTKIDTQISMRFAQQFACSFVEDDCQDKDFIYTIRAGSSIIGGPSAGAAATALTISMLDGITLRDDVVATGTINPGGLIGGVGGLQEKIRAAAMKNYSTVLIPSGKRMLEDDNESLDLVEFGEKVGVTVKEVASIEELLSEYSDKNFTRPTGEIVVDPQYQEIMRSVANKLCERNQRLREVTPKESGLADEVEADYLVEAEKNIAKADALFKVGKYYAGASFCFGANIDVAYVNARRQNLTKTRIIQGLAGIKQAVDNLTSEVEQKPIRSITDLQTSLIVKERLVEADDRVAEAIRGESDPTYALAVANERLYSAVVWSEFFKSVSTEYSIDSDRLERSCQEKLQEAEERIQYVSIYLPDEPQRVRDDIERAYQSAKQGDPGQCLFIASKAKAEADVIISLLGSSQEHVERLLEEKSQLAKEAIIQSAHRGVFPIIGYSYYQYAQTLADQDKGSALRFTEYAIEISSLELYFPRPRYKVEVDTRNAALFASGLFCGAVFWETWRRKRYKRSKREEA